MTSPTRILGARIITVANGGDDEEWWIVPRPTRPR